MPCPFSMHPEVNPHFRAKNLKCQPNMKAPKDMKKLSLPNNVIRP